MSSVIIYTYFSSPSADYNLDFFVKKELSYKNNIDYIIVINGYNYNKNIVFPTIANLTILKRPNHGYDFAGHNHALKYIKSHSKTYDYYFFMNSGVIGPILHENFKEAHWTNVFIKKINNRVKLVGTTIVAKKPKPIVEGFFFMVDKIGLELLKKHKTIFSNHSNKNSAVNNAEFQLAKCILNNKYTIDCMLPRYKGVNWRNPKNYNLNNGRFPSRKNYFYGRSINPFDVIFHKWFWHSSPNVNFEIVKKYVDDFHVNNKIIPSNINPHKISGKKRFSKKRFSKKRLGKKRLNRIHKKRRLLHSLIRKRRIKRFSLKNRKNR